MLKPGQKNSYQKFLEKKRKFAKKVKQGKIFKDTDRDGLCDYEEKYIYGTDCKNPDTDHDGMNDGDEVKRGRNPLGPGRLKDLFIPHAGNNYHPHALHPKRLLFHAASVIAIKLVVVVFVLFYPLSAFLSPDLALAQAKKIIELTNNLRQAISLPALAENQQLAQAAWQKVEDMALNQYFAHVSPSGVSLRNWLEKIGYKYSMAGENLAVGFSKAEDVVAAWEKSPTHYDNIIDKNFKVLDIGCGTGVLGIGAAKLFNADVAMSDINKRAVMLAKMNCKLNNVKCEVFQGNLYEKIKQNDFDVVLSNPPQTAGKEICFQLIEQSKKYLKNKGSLQLVARHNKGGKTLSKKMEEVYGNVKIAAKKAGYWVYVSVKE